MNENREDSLNKRYLSKLLSNSISLIVGILTTIIITRFLGPKDFGNFEFINSFFRELIPFFTFTASIGFFTKLSQRKRDHKLVIYFRYLLIVGMSLLFIFVASSFLLNLNDMIWHSQEKTTVYLGMTLCILTVFTSFLGQVADASGITISLEIVRVIQKLMGILFLSLLAGLSLLNLENYFLFSIFMQILLFALLLYVLRRVGIYVFDEWYLSKKEIKRYGFDLYEYSKPLFVYAVLGVVVGIFDRWILQAYAGSEHQAYFGLGQKIGSICFLFTSSMTILITREFSIAHFKNDLKKIRTLFRRYVPMLYSIASFFSCFVFVNAENIIKIFSGDAYQDALLPLILLSLFPIHQTYGQLNSSVFFAMNKTKIYRNIGITFMIVGTFLSFFLIAPESRMGLDYGSTGLAFKVLFMQFLHVNVYLYFNSKFLKFNFIKYLLHQIIVVTFLLVVAYVAKKTVIHFMFQIEGTFVQTFTIGTIYSLYVIPFTLITPKLFGLYKEDVSLLKTFIKKYN